MENYLNIYIYMIANKLLTLIYCIHMEIFLRKVRIVTLNINVTFKEYNKVIRYDLNDISNKLNK